MSLRASPIRRLELFNRESTGSETLVLSSEMEKLAATIYSKNLEIQELYEENKQMKKTYDSQIDSYLNTIRLLETKLKELEVSRGIEFEVIKEKYDKMAQEESESMKSYHSHEIEFLLKEIAHLRVDSAAKDEKLAIMQTQITGMTESYDREIEEKINEVNNLTRTLLSMEDNKNREIKEISEKRELEKSRTSGMLSSRKENNQFMDKQIRKLNQEILEKAIKIENLSREVNRTKRRCEEIEKALNKKIQDLISEKEDEAQEREEHFAKIEKSLKQEILEFRSNQVKFLSEIDSLKGTIEINLSDIQSHKSAIQSRDEQINGYKQLLNKQRDDHAKEISNLMKDKKRRSSNMGSSRSLTSSLRDAGGAGGAGGEEQTASVLKKMDSVKLAIVKEESPDKSLSRSMEHSRLSEESEDGELMKVIYHYDTLVQELKQSHSCELQLMRQKVSKMTKSLDEKQQELLDILTRFSPLVKIHTEEKSVEEDRKERIERHWKADVALLEIMLQKYRIKAYD